jgi:hypothetical protein
MTRSIRGLAVVALAFVLGAADARADELKESLTEARRQVNLFLDAGGDVDACRTRFLAAIDRARALCDADPDERARGARVLNAVLLRAMFAWRHNVQLVATPELLSRLDRTVFTAARAEVAARAIERVLVLPRPVAGWRFKRRSEALEKERSIRALFDAATRALDALLPDGVREVRLLAPVLEQCVRDVRAVHVAVDGQAPLSLADVGTIFDETAIAARMEKTTAGLTSVDGGRR